MNTSCNKSLYLILSLLFLNSLKCKSQSTFTAPGFIGLNNSSQNHYFSIFGNADISFPDRRNFIHLKNTSFSNSSFTGLLVESSTNSAINLAQYPSNYFLSYLANFGQVNGTNGLLLSTGDYGVIKFINGTSSNFERMRINSNGYVGIGTNNPTYLFSLQANAGNGSQERFMMNINNISDAYDSGAILRINSGSNGSGTTLSHHSPSYSHKMSFADNGQLYSYGAGLIVRSGTSNYPNAPIKFITGNNPAGFGYERLRISENGNVGIGDFDQGWPNDTPKSKLHVQNGDVYISNNLNGVILKSPNGNCFKVSVNDSGQIYTSFVGCPN